ncbi:alpha-amylase family glycosyl hydrolase [Luteimonas sp. SX5]|uniref:Alpha-amylase family glycosyl hydrolase n=1 Tax=Luteimonas galliterrae TaxID=2940486 RepID=A0ABT0MFC1_9GAMM|nr:alpha-amylase family glycosyl hydrolase [Luteimonas galliterrae]MCL1633040.1 alpha-amylase family glycosyl hydrolase [Luteimonas galliterrae]
MTARGIALLAGVALLAGCARTDPPSPAATAKADNGEAYYGTLEPFASHAVYFVVTDRFVNGDTSNDQREQGGAHRTFDVPTPDAPAGESDNIGYLGGDFKGVADNAGYIRDMGFGAVWITPIADNPNEAFTGGKPITWGSSLTDRGKTGYHGYWGVDFYRLDEHLPSAGLDFAGFTRAMHAQDLKVVLDIVGNHGSPAYTMPKPQPMFGQIFDKDGKLIADHQNLPPAELDPRRNPLHAFYNTGGGLAELSDFNENNPAVLEYLVGAYEQWIGQGADAFRIDTIGWMPDAFWHRFTTRIRDKHPGFFMFGEDFNYDAGKIAHHTWPQNAGASVLDFPLKQGLDEVFGRKRAGFERLREPLHLQDGPYANPYELMTFYDNHDMARMDATDEGFIDAHNWLFTARGIPVIYYGSEIGFMRGRAEHAGNRNYFGQQRVDAARTHPIRERLKRIADLRAQSPALQRGLQVNLELQGDRAAFYRVYQREGEHQIALVLLNKGDAPARFELLDVQPGAWRGAFGGQVVEAAAGTALAVDVQPHDVQVLLLDVPVSLPALRTQLSAAMGKARHR